jgi:hypothetical protein
MASPSTKPLNLIAEVGATLIHRVTVSDSSGPIDWTTPAATAKLQVRTELGGEIVVELTQAAGLTLGAAGEIDIRVEATEDWLPAGAPSPLTTATVYVYDLVVTQASPGLDGTFRIVEGRVEVRPGVTAPPP